MKTILHMMQEIRNKKLDDFDNLSKKEKEDIVKTFQSLSTYETVKNRELRILLSGISNITRFGDEIGGRNPENINKNLLDQATKAIINNISEIERNLKEDPEGKKMLRFLRLE